MIGKLTHWVIRLPIQTCKIGELQLATYYYIHAILWVLGFRVLDPIYYLLKFAEARLVLHMVPNSPLQSKPQEHHHTHTSTTICYQHQEVGIELADSLQISLPTSPTCFPSHNPILVALNAPQVCGFSCNILLLFSLCDFVNS